MAEGLVTDLIKQVISIAAREVEQELRLVVGVDKEVRKLEGNLQTVHLVLSDAEKRQVTDKAVKLWLKKLEDVSYEMDDVLDEWNTAMIKLEIEKVEEENTEKAHVVKKKVCSFIPFPSCCFHHVDKLFLRHDIAHKIKEVNEKLDEVVRERKRYGFELNKGPSHEVAERPKTTSFVDVSEICGRDNVKVDLVNILLGKGSEEERSPYVISLVGMGGIGKTTLAQLAYNDPKVQAHFDIKMWVCVSDPFDQCRVAKAIIQEIGGIHFTCDDITELETLLRHIQELIQKKKFFLVLDDVWTEDHKKWEPFSKAFKQLESSQNSRILVTTRKIRVAKIMGSTSTRMINLEVLSEENCWLVFSKIVFSDKDPKQCEQLEDLGKQIAKKCKGLPLAAKTLGSLLRFMQSREQWNNVLDSNLWELEDVENVVEKDLFAPLLLSYNDLPSPLKRCFSFCAIFPKDYKFYLDDLVFMWMAQGYIDSKENMEIIGREYFENLAIRSFFQDFEIDHYDGKIKVCKKHDIVHDFAQSITKNECFTINSVTESRSNYRNARHLHLEIPDKAQFPVSVYDAKNLRTLILKFPEGYNLSNLFQYFRYLRTLTLYYRDDNSEELPGAVENFMHLRYLNLINYNGDELPETICNLCNLQVLKISSTSPWLNKFPHGMSKLINLRHFILDSFYGDNQFKLPRGIGRLTSLRTLSGRFSLSGKDDNKGCNLGELKNLNQLQGSLEIRGLGNVIDVCEAKNAQLKKKIHLRYLKLYFTREIAERMENDASVLNAIEPPPNLEYLRIQLYRGTTMSFNWMMSLTKLKMLELQSLEKLEHLPPLGKLPFLERLDIWLAISLEKVGVEFLGIESKHKKDDKIKIFPNLKSLHFEYLEEWKEWIGIRGMREEEEDSSITIMPCLQKLSIWNCPKLKSLPDFLCTTPLKELQINCSPLLRKRYQREEVGQREGEDWPKISHIPNIRIDY